MSTDQYHADCEGLANAMMREDGKDPNLADVYTVSTYRALADDVLTDEDKWLAASHPGGATLKHLFRDGADVAVCGRLLRSAVPHRYDRPICGHCVRISQSERSRAR